MSQTKTCTRCGDEGPLSAFRRWDALCKVCRLEVGPRKRPKTFPPWGGTRPIHTIERPPKPKPSGRVAVPHEYARRGEKVSA